ncbi:hypothetical protein F4775DRAFT_556149 [Biscogniauxia sp. FL1348]|nr:hypothetical protein F4775DRAFT_556149 [Biscogniauxia sp. FL1348]
MNPFRNTVESRRAALAARCCLSRCHSHSRSRCRTHLLPPECRPATDRIVIPHRRTASITTARPAAAVVPPTSTSISTMDAAEAKRKKRLALFEDSMQRVYGPYDASTDPEHWQPPTNPGAGGHRGRYLWTDAFGVVNFVTLAREKGPGPSRAYYLALAERLASTVHEVLGRERGDDNDATTTSSPSIPARLPGATDEQPLAGGLRIGKAAATGPDGDGQYHHYLTLWMFALSRLALATGRARWNALAVQLARAALPRFFVARPGSGETLVWKMATDLRSVLVHRKGHLDDLDGLVICRVLQGLARRLGGSGGGEGGGKGNGAGADDVEALEGLMARYRRMVEKEPAKTPSGDPLDLGMGLWISHLDRDAPWSRRLAAQGLRLARARFLAACAAPLTEASRRRRLAFREFGACLGIECYGAEEESLLAGVEEVLGVWEGRLTAEGGADDDDLRPINLVMYAAALIPGAFRDGYVPFPEPKINE